MLLLLPLSCPWLLLATPGCSSQFLKTHQMRDTFAHTANHALLFLVGKLSRGAPLLHETLVLQILQITCNNNIACLQALLGSPKLSRGSPKVSRALLGPPGLSWDLRGSPGLSGALQGSPGLCWAVLGSSALSSAPLGSPGLSRAFMQSPKRHRTPNHPVAGLFYDKARQVNSSVRRRARERPRASYIQTKSAIQDGRSPVLSDKICHPRW
jgi:hypothetical protein